MRQPLRCARTASPWPIDQGPAPGGSKLGLLGISMDAREKLMEAKPGTFQITPHCKDYPSVLARIATLHPGSFRNFLERKWRTLAPKKVVKDYDAVKAI